MSESPTVAFPSTAPTGAGTTVLFDSTTVGAGWFLRHVNANRYEVVIQNDQAGTIKGYWSANGGTTWNQYDSQTVAIPAAGASSGPYDYHLDAFKDFKAEWVNGGSNQTTWRGTATLICGDRPKAS